MKDFRFRFRNEVGKRSGRGREEVGKRSGRDFISGCFSSITGEAIGCGTLIFSCLNEATENLYCRLACINFREYTYAAYRGKVESAWLILPPAAKGSV